MKVKIKARRYGLFLFALLIVFSSLIPSFVIGVSDEDQHLTEFKQLRDNIYKRYQKDANSQWEWANIGFYEGMNNKIEGGYRKTVEDLPKGYNLYKIIEDLDSRSIAGMGQTVGGTVIALTAMGIDASNLKPYEVDGKPFKTRDRKDATNLVKFIYDSNPGGINFCTWGLIALDMGNYPTPTDANSTREKLLERILNHEYGSDGFAVDMVAMVMQSLYPYQNDSIYGERVKEKLEHGLDLFQGHKIANKVEQMDKNFMFKSWGTVNSESTAHVIIALCNMGIDPFTDYRFSRSGMDNLIYNWVNLFATNTNDGFGHTNNQFNSIGTEQGMYALQCYINFKENGGKEPYSLWYDGVPFNYGDDENMEKIECFELLGQEAQISSKTNTITIIMPNSVPIESLKGAKPKIKLGNGYTLDSNIQEEQDFTNKDIVYTIKSRDGTTTNYNVNIINGPNWFNKFTLRGVEGEIDKLNNEIKIELPYGTYVDKIRPNIIEVQSIDREIKILPDIDVAMDFSQREGTKVILDSQRDGGKVEYTTIVNYIETKGYSEIREFSIGEHKAEIDGKSIILTLPKGVTKEKFITENQNKTPTIKGSYESIDPDPKQIDNFKNSLENYLKDYVLVDEDGKLNLYNVKFVEYKTDVPENKDPNRPPQKTPEPGKPELGKTKEEKTKEEKPLNIESFRIGTSEGQIDNANGRIFIEVPYELDLTNVVPTITLSKGSVYPVSGKVLNLKKTATFTLSDGNVSKRYSLIIMVAQPKPTTKLWKYIKEYSDPQDYQVIIGGEY